MPDYIPDVLSLAYGSGKGVYALGRDPKPTEHFDIKFADVRPNTDYCMCSTMCAGGHKQILYQNDP